MCALAFIVVSPAKAQDESYRAPFASSPNWSIVRDRGFCTMAINYVNKLSKASSLLVLTYDDRLGSAKLMFNDPGVRSLREGDKRKLSIKFIVNDRLDEGWGEREFLVLPPNPMFEGATFGAKFTGEMLDDFARSQTIGFYYGDVLLQAYKLEASALAIKNLRQCANEEASLNPSDPFK